VCGEEVSFVMDVLEAGRGGREERRSLLEEEASRHASRLEKWRNRIRPSAVLEWDEVQKKVVARRMQVGLSVSHLSPSAGESACYNKRTGLVDTFVVPDELAQLKDLKSILSLEIQQAGSSTLTSFKECFSDPIQTGVCVCPAD
jgi:hypothetical protein